MQISLPTEREREKGKEKGRERGSMWIWTPHRFSFKSLAEYWWMHVRQLSKAGKGSSKRTKGKHLQRSQGMRKVLAPEIQRDCKFVIKGLWVEYSEVCCLSSGAELVLQYSSVCSHLKEYKSKLWKDQTVSKSLYCTSDKDQEY